jgi:TonB family protein
MLLLAWGVPCRAAGEPPVRVGGQITEPAKIHNVPPMYPDRARLAGRQDIVFLDAVIDDRGKVTDVQPLRGSAEFAKAATDAVLKWRYRPTLLDGRPVSVVLTVTVAFFLAGFAQTPVVAAALTDPSESIRLKTVDYLGVSRLESEPALALLRTALQDDSPAVRDRAQHYISRLEKQPR